MFVQSIDVLVFCALVASVLAIARLSKRDRSPAVEEVEPSAFRIRRDTALKDRPIDSSLFVRFDRSLEQALIQGGLSINGGRFLLILLCIGSMGIGLMLVLGMHLIIQIAVLVSVICIGLIGAFVCAKMRLGKFAKLFPSSLELLARATRAGASLDEAFQMVARSSEEPVKGEFQQCVQQLRLGLSAQVVADDLAERIDSVDVHLFSHTLSIHQRLGGKLADSLERLSTVIRNRSECEEKVKSMTSIGRYSVIGIVIMGGFVLTYMLMAEPDYVDNLFTSSLGQKLLIYACVSELIGLIWVGLTLKSDL